MMKISTSTLRSLAVRLAEKYPFSIHTIYTEARIIAKENGYQLIMELEGPLVDSLDEMLKKGII